MDWNAVWQWLLSSGIGAGVAAIIVKLWSDQRLERIKAGYVSQLEAQKHQATLEAQKLKHQADIEVEELKQHLAVRGEQVKRFSEAQFTTYLKLWTQLQEMKTAAENLWEEASLSNLESFGEELKKTRRLVELSGLILDAHHYQEIQDILSTFERFRVGKKRVIDLRAASSESQLKAEYHKMNSPGGLAPSRPTDRNLKRTIEDWVRSQILRQIEYNYDVMGEYEQLLTRVRLDMQGKLSLSDS